MAWNNDDNKGPWGGKKPDNNNRRTQGPQDLEDLLKKGSSNFKKMMGGGGSSPGTGKLALFAVIGGLILWIGTGFYRVGEAERAVVTRFGKFNRMVDQGLRYHIPSPIEDVRIINVSNIRTFKSDTITSSRREQSFRGEDISNMMLTGDENILKVRYSVQWFVKDPVAFVFNDPRPEETVKLAADSAVREIIAQRTMDEARTSGKAQIIKDAKDLLQRLIDEYQVGIEIVKINLEEVTPPESVTDAFRDVQRAIADKERTINKARAYENSIVPVARGKAQQIIQAAEAEKLATINTAQGETARFDSVYVEYAKAPEVTEVRLILQSIEKVLGNMNKMILGTSAQGAGSIVPYLPLNELKPSANSQSGKPSKTTVLEQAQQEVSLKAQQQAVETR